MMKAHILTFSLLIMGALSSLSARAELRVAPFDIDVTPVTGQMLAYVPMLGVDQLSLRARGYVLTGAGDPIVICAVDWIGISNGTHDAFRDALAEAASTTRDRVAVQTLHQHDAPGSDFTAAAILKAAGRDLGRYDPAITQPGIDRTAAAVKEAMEKLQPLTHISIGIADVKQVASNRRILGPDGKVRGTRTSATKSAQLRAEPEGLIDPEITVIGFWNGDHPLFVTSYYATHPMSYYLVGFATPDFPGMARLMREIALPGVLHIHFNGASGNITAGKYNDGSHENRPILAKRLADGMAAAWENSKKSPISAEDIGWKIEPIHFNNSKENSDLVELRAKLSNPIVNPNTLRSTAARLAWLEWNKDGRTVDLTCLRLGSLRILHLPGEPFIEYQLAAKKMRSDVTVAVAGYGNYGMGYIGNSIAYEQGGYEIGASAVAPDSEEILMKAMEKLLTD